MTLLTSRECAVCREAVDYYGRRRQLRKVAEELRELAIECDRASCGNTDIEALELERADVEIVLYQLDTLLYPDLLPMIPFKIAKQISRLEKRIIVSKKARGER